MTAWYVVLLTVVLAGVGTFVVVRLRTDLMAAEDRSLRAAIGQIAAGYQAEGRAEFRDVSQTVLAGEHAASQITRIDGRVVASFGDPVALGPMLGAGQRRRAAAGKRVVASRALGRGHASFRVVARPVTRHGRDELLVAGASLAPVDRSVHRVLTLLLLALPAAIIATAVGGWWLARRALRPIDRMTRSAASIGAGRLDERVPVARTRDEVSQLAQTLNAMLDRIEHAVGEQHRLIADTSHELRTPLAIMRSEVDVSLRTDRSLSPETHEALASIREELEHMSAIVDDLLTLAAADEGRLGLEPEPTDLLDLAGRSAMSLEEIARRRGIAIDVEGGAALALADPDRARQAIRNLLANAVDFSPDNGRVTVWTWAEGEQVGVDVVDQGPGVPADLRDRIFDRFFRSDDSRTRKTGGSGLGLAIAREVARAHNGTITVARNEPRGSRFSLRLPAA
jgi:two-component system OmpR family sensor kinase